MCTLQSYLEALTHPRLLNITFTRHTELLRRRGVGDLFHPLAVDAADDCVHNYAAHRALQHAGMCVNVAMCMLETIAYTIMLLIVLFNLLVCV